MDYNIISLSVDSTKTVSYTHLDVYKRQVFVQSTEQNQLALTNNDSTTKLQSLGFHDLV